MMQSSIFRHDSAVSSNGNHRHVSPVRVLVVDDFEPFRRLVCSTVRNDPKFRSLLRPQTGLKQCGWRKNRSPTWSSLILACPSSTGSPPPARYASLLRRRRLYSSRRNSPDVAQEAFRSGAMAYVVKIYAGTDLPAAMEAALEGKRFRSAAVSGK